MRVHEDFSIEATKGYILYELESLGPCTHQHFLVDADEQDKKEVNDALDDLLKDDTILRKGQMFFLPKKNKGG